MPNPNPPTPSSTPSPLPAPARKSASSRRRQRLLASPKPSSAPTTSSSASSASSASSSSASFSFAPYSPAPSPFHHRFLSPLRASAVPFSWEHRPGIPKTPARGGAGTRTKSGANKPAPLPLPPSLFSNRVVAEYPLEAYSVVPDNKARRRKQQRRWPAVTDALTEWLAVLSLYRSCTRSRDSLAASAGPPPQARRCSPA